MIHQFSLPFVKKLLFLICNLNVNKYLKFIFRVFFKNYLPYVFIILASDEELFEDNPEEYIRRDIEGSDVDTRRRAACDLVKALSKEFEQITMSSFGLYVKVCLKCFLYYVL